MIFKSGCGAEEETDNLWKVSRYQNDFQVATEQNDFPLNNRHNDNNNIIIVFPEGPFSPPLALMEWLVGLGSKGSPIKRSHW